MSEGIFDRIQLSSKRKFQDYGYQSKPVDDLKTARIKKVSRSKSGGKRMSNKMLESTPKKSLDYDPIGMKSRVNQHVNGLTKDERIKELQSENDKLRQKFSQKKKLLDETVELLEKCQHKIRVYEVELDCCRQIIKKRKTCHEGINSDLVEASKLIDIVGSELASRLSRCLSRLNEDPGKLGVPTRDKASINLSSSKSELLILQKQKERISAERDLQTAKLSQKAASWSSLKRKLQGIKEKIPNWSLACIDLCVSLTAEDKRPLKWHMMFKQMCQTLTSLVQLVSTVTHE